MASHNRSEQTPSLATSDRESFDDKQQTITFAQKKDIENSFESSDEKNDVADPNVVGWENDHDSDNPMNWSVSKKASATAVVSLITMLSPLASTVISPATPMVMETFQSTNQTLAAFVTSVYLLGYAFGPLVIAPLSELYGRVIMYNSCNVFFLLFSIACALAPSLNSLIAFRFLAGIAASCAITISSGSVADMIVAEKRGLAMGAMIVGPLLGPTFGPIAGSYLSQAKGWRWIFWMISIVAGVVVIVAFLVLRETNAYVILQRKTRRRQEETGNPHLRSMLDTGKTPRDLFTFSIVRPVKMLIFSPIVLLLSLYNAIVYGYLYLMFTTFPRIFEGEYKFSATSIGLVYFGTGAGSFIGLVISAALSDRQVQILKKKRGGDALPEYRLPAMILGAILIPIALFLYGWTAEKHLHYMIPIVGTGILGAGMFMIMMPTMIYLIDAFTVYAASATAAATVVRSIIGALLPLAGDSMYDALGVGWGTSLLGFIAVAFIPVPLLFFVYGKRIRESKVFSVQF